MKAKRILAGLLSAAMVLSLAACAGGGGESSTAPSESTPPSESTADKTNTADEITIWAWDDNFNVKAANIAKEYYAKVNPDVKVNVVSMAQDDIVQKLNTAFSGPNYEGLPNIVLIEDYRIQGYLQNYDALRDLSAIVDPA